MSEKSDVGSAPNNAVPQHVLDDRHPQDDDLHDDFAEFPDDEDRGGPTPKPVSWAADQRVLSALTRDTDLLAGVRQPGALVALVVEDSWSSEILASYFWEVWKTQPERRDRYSSRRGTRAPCSVQWKLDATKHAVDDAEKSVADGAADGRGTVLVVSDLDMLHPAIRAVIDIVVEVPVLDVSGLRAVAAAVGHGRATLVPRGLPGVVQPEHLRLAVRAGQSAEDFVDRLRRIVSAEQSAEAPKKPAVPRWTLDKLHGQPDVVAFGRSLATDLADYRAGALAWSDVAPGVLLSGPPGCGKTLAAQAIAHACGVPLVATSYSEWQSAGGGHLGTLTKALKAKFTEARRRAPCVLFVDELDSVRARGVGKYDDWWTAIVNTLLEELDGVAGRPGVVVVAASNFPENVDAAIRRSGRLDKEIRLLLPDASALMDIFFEYLGDSVSADDLRRLATAGLGGSGADVARWTRGGRQRARHARRELVADDVLAEIRGANADRDPILTWRVAVHEAGHAVLTVLERPGSIVSVSVRADAGTEGGCLSRIGPSASLESEIDVLLRERLGGRAAEEVVLGEAGGGSGGRVTSDLAAATVLATAAETSLGLRGLTWRGDPTPDSVPLMLATDRDLADCVEVRLQAALSGARDLLRHHRSALDAVAAALLDRETLAGAEVESLVASHGPEQHQVPRISETPAAAKECVR